ncbi:MAG: hypothetical protein HN948_07985 [Clostridia bacterium]|nr:hypothetical protein [Clostridia bacterium]
MKKFVIMLIVLMLLVSIIGITTAFAGASISSANSTVYAGRSYTYKGTASYSAGDIVCKIEGLGKVSSGFAASTSGGNQSLTATASIKVSIPSNANMGDTYTITFSGSYSVMNAEGGVESEHDFIKYKTLTVGVPPTRDPNATPTPLEGWEIVEEAIINAEDGAVVEAAMEGDYKIPENLLKMLIEKKNTLVIDFGTYKCTIDPAMLTDFDEIGTLDLSLMFDKVTALSEAASELDLYQMHFGHSGELPGLLMFTFEAVENVPGDIVFLYYYYGEANVVEGKASAVVDENGMLTFQIYHCSSYIVTGEILPVAMSNFDTESAQALEQMGTTLEEAQEMTAHTQSALDDSNAQVDKLTGDLAAQAELDEVPEAQAEEAEVALESEKGLQSVSMVVFIAAIVAVLLLSILLTMMFCKAGLFKRVVEREAEQAPEDEEPVAQRSEAKLSRQQAKRDAMNMKEQAKQDAMDAKHQEKLDKMETKRLESEAQAQARQGAIDAKAQAKQDAIDAKAQAKQDAIDAKAQAKQAKKMAKDDGDGTQI